MNALLLELLPMAERIRERVRDHPDKSRLSEDVGIVYHRLTYMAKKLDSAMRHDDLEKLARYFGYQINVVAPPEPPKVDFPPEGWREHPTAPPHPVVGRWFYKGQIVKSETQLREMVATPIAAE